MSGVFLITPVVAFILLKLFGSKEMTIRETAIPFGLVSFVTLLLILKLIFIAASIAFVIQGSECIGVGGWQIYSCRQLLSLFVLPTREPRKFH
jgi:hypothetical protein